MAGVDAMRPSGGATPEDNFPSLTFAVQSLLARHEAYMASAERDRLELTARIEQLERDNATLEAKNKQVTDENHTLREELDQLNDTVKDTETKMAFLETTLRDSQQEVRRLEIAAERAASLERQIAVLEEEQLVLQTSIVRTQEEARTTMYRWRQAEKGLSDLQEQLERMEKEAREERERHVEVVGRMERQRVMEKELNTAAGRLKGAAALKSMTDSRGTGNVVSHFVRDLLQDNANLQVGMAELREMLLSSNDEIQMLREQLMYHQPLAAVESSSPTTLHAELAKKEPPTPPQPPRVSQELHIHHHYHVTHKPEVKKPRKRRQGLTSGTFTPPHVSAPGTPIASPLHWQRPVLSPLPSNSSAPNASPWSLQNENRSDFDPSSAPSSPRSTNRNSVFDRLGDLPSPTSPTTSVDPTSPTWKNAHRKKISEFSLRSISEAVQFPGAPSHSQPQAPVGHRPRPHPLTHFVLNGDRSPHSITSPYTTDDVPISTAADYADDINNANTNNPLTDDNILSPVSEDFDSTTQQQLPQPHRRIRRAQSHESIISLSNGLDIHTLKARPSQLALRPLGLTAAGTGFSAVIAEPTMVGASGGRDGRRGSVMLRDSIGAGAKQTGGDVQGQGGGGGMGSLVVGKMGTWRGRSRGSRAVSGPVKGGNTGDDEGVDAERYGGKERERSSSKAPLGLGKLVSWRPWGGGGSGGNNDTSGANGNADPDTQTSPCSTPVLAASPTAVPTSAAVPTLSLLDTSLSLPISTSTSTPTAASALSTASKSPPKQGSTVLSPATATPTATSVFRAPGINQPGMVPGFQEYWAAKQRRPTPAPAKLTVEAGREQQRESVAAAVREALGEGLGEGSG